MRAVLILFLHMLRAHLDNLLLRMVILALGCALVLLVFAAAHQNLTVEEAIPDHDRIYQIAVGQKNEEGRWVYGWHLPAPARAVLARAYPDFDIVARSFPQQYRFRQDERFLPAMGTEADPAYLALLPLRMITGQAALPDPASILLSRLLAERLFGTTAVAGRTVATGGDRPRRYRIVGVYEDLPRQSRMHHDFIARFDETSSSYFDWNSTNVLIFARLRPGGRIADFPAVQKALIDRMAAAIGSRDPHPSTHMRLVAVPLPKARFFATEGELYSPYLLRLAVLSVAAILVVAVGMLNGVQLMVSALFEHRRRMGLLKVAGLTTGAVARLALAETGVTVLGGGLLGWAVAMILRPWVSSMMGETLALTSLWRQPGAWLIMLGLLVAFATALILPALLHARMRPARLLHPLAPGRSARGRAMVALQYAVALSLAFAMVTVGRQLIFLQHRPLGFEPAHLLGVRDLDDPARPTAAERFLAQVRRIPGVVSASRAFNLPGDGWLSRRELHPVGFHAPGPVGVEINPVDYGFFATIAARVLAGRTLDPDHGGDSLSIPPGVATGQPREEDPYVPANAVISAGVVRLLGFSTAEQALGRRVRVGLGYGQGNAEFTIVGVVDDIHYRGAKARSVPTIYYRAPGFLRHLILRVKAGEEARVQERLISLWRQAFPDRPLITVLIRERLAAAYRPERRLLAILGGFGALALLLALLGLYGAARLMLAGSEREAALRKLHGAPLGRLFALLSRRCLTPVLLGAMVAGPASWILLARWLAGFPDHVRPGPASLLLLLAGALLLALLVLVRSLWAVVAKHPVAVLRG